MLQELQAHLVHQAIGSPPPSNPHKLYQRMYYRNTRAAIQNVYSCLEKHCVSELRACHDDVASKCQLLISSAIIGGGFNCEERLRAESKYGSIVWEGTPLQAVLGCIKTHCEHEKRYHRVSGMVTSGELARIGELTSTALEEGRNAGILSWLQEFRTFGDSELSDDDKEKKKLGHNVTFVHRVFQDQMPELYDRLKQAAVDADISMGWGVHQDLGLKKDDLKLRNVEIIEYTAGQESWQVLSSEFGCGGQQSGNGARFLRSAAPGAHLDLADCKKLCVEELMCSAIDWNSNRCDLFDDQCDSPSASNRSSHILRSGAGQLGMHTDTGSMLSLSVALSDPSEYVGGIQRFGGGCANVSQVPKSGLGDVVVWPSGFPHGVTPVVSGRRAVMVLEFWEFCTQTKDRPAGRPSSGEFRSDCESWEDMCTQPEECEHIRPRGVANASVLLEPEEEEGGEPAGLKPLAVGNNEEDLEDEEPSGKNGDREVEREEEEGVERGVADDHEL
eukprot:TRINITY_DN19005_c0_g1_i4.p1 TRINITY_DN19005_c0_g1~~TRINITY_DN19005_c0_g1_i4.p1  ORF type:complete len:502 (-),score=94.97 TRINITY_DN19005_c0_g1_i4:26-1531(-)